MIPVMRATLGMGEWEVGSGFELMLHSISCGDLLITGQGGLLLQKFLERLENI